jgi:S1-C subfamily serine protease
MKNGEVMKKFHVVFCFMFILVTAFFGFCGCAGGYSGITGTPDVNINMTPRMISAGGVSNFEDIVDVITPAVVGISAIYNNVESVGSGVSLAQGGYILTNHHVVYGASSITVYYANKTSGRAQLIWADQATDLAIIKASIDMPYLSAGDSDILKTGEEVIAVGTPLTLQFKHTVTKGIISALDRTIEIDNTDGTTSYLQNLIQHDASINPGNSGGPLINVNGEVIGINTLKVTEAEGIGFALPIEVALPVLNQIIKNGKYDTPFLGMFGLDSAIAEFYGRTVEGEGVYIVNVDASGPVSKAGLIKGDIIKKVEGVEIKTMLDLRKEIFNCNVGDTISVTFIREGGERTTQLTLTPRPR